MDFKTDKYYPFDNISLANPRGVHGGIFFSKILFSNQKLAFQTPKCKSKNGIHAAGKRVYCDLLFTGEDDEFIVWVQALEERIKDLIYENKSAWFHTEPDREEINYNWNESIRSFKRTNFLLRTTIDKDKMENANEFSIWDEDENQLSLSDIDDKSELINVIEIVGVKFTSQSFNLIIKLRQVMLIKPKNYFNKCLIKINTVKEEKIRGLEDDGSKIVNVVDMSNTEDAAEELKTNMSNTEDVVEDVVEDVAEELIITGMGEHNMENEEISSSTGSIDKPEGDKNPNHLEDEVIKSNLDKIETEKRDNYARKIQTLFRNFLKRRGRKEVSNNILSNDLEQSLTEIDIGTLDVDKDDILQLKNPREVYINIYKAALAKAKDAKKHALETWLEANRIKDLFLLDEIEMYDSDNEICGELGEGGV
jgi:hypothetical protein